MSIKLRLVLSYIAMVIIPFFLTGIAAFIIFGLLYNSNTTPKNIFGTYAQNISQAYIDIQRTLVDNPDKLLDEVYVSKIDHGLSDAYTGIVVTLNNKTIYISKILNKPEITNSILKNNSNNKIGNSYGYADFHQRGNGSLATILDHKFTAKDNKKAEIYLISDFKPIGIFFGKYFSLLGLAILIILLFTNVLLTVIISTSITKPLKLLKYGTEQIKEGNLNFEIKSKSRDEIGEVCRAFEQMRCKLKESIDTQLQFEENRKELISSISHDLKTPVTSIKGYVEGIMDGVADSPEKMEKYIKTIYSKANDLDRLIDDLFLFSKLDLKKVPFNFEKVQIVKYFEDCIEEMKIDLEKRDVKLIMSTDCSSDLTVKADREKLKRVIVNIIENAVKYMDKDEKQINIDINCDKGTTIIKVKDNGQGIKKEELQFIFDRFFRADASRNSETGGSGLGLSIAKQIIEGHEGKIWAESEYGKETTISFTLKGVSA